MHLMRLNKKDISGTDFVLLIADLMDSAPGNDRHQLIKILMFMHSRSIYIITVQCLTTYKLKIIPYHITFDSGNTGTGCICTHRNLLQYGNNIAQNTKMSNRADFLSNSS